MDWLSFIMTVSGRPAGNLPGKYQETIRLIWNSSYKLRFGLKYEDYHKHEDDLKYEDNLKYEDDLKYEDILKYEADLKFA